MLIGLVKRLGEIKLKESSDIILERLLASQNPYRLTHIYAVEIDLEKDTFKIITEEYDSNKENLYLRGIQGGNSENLSPVLNIKPTELAKNPEKVINLRKFPTEQTLFEKQGLNREEFPIYLSLIQWYDRRKDDLANELLNKIQQEYYDDKSKKVDKKAPTLLVFKLLLNGSPKYPGEIPEFKDAYVVLSTPPSPTDSVTGLCMACGRLKPLTPVQQVNTSLFEFFTLDLNNFVLGMEQKYSNQLTLCIDCQEITKLGLSVLENELSFKAYTRTLDSKNTLFVNHALLPTAFSNTLVQGVMESLSKIRRDRAEEIRRSYRKELEELSQRLSRVDKKAARELKKQIKEIKEQLAKVKDLEEVDERFILDQFAKNGVSYIDLFYTLEQAGVGSFKKVFMDLTFVNAGHLKRLMDNIVQLETEFSKRGLLYWKEMPYRFEFGDLYALFSIKIADLVRNALLTGYKVSAAELARDAQRNLRDPFLKLNAKLNKNISISRAKYNRMMNTFLFVHDLLERMELLKE